MNQTIVVGAGLSGLIAALELHKRGRYVMILEKSKGVGGRIATRRESGTAFDHGAQFFELKDGSPNFYKDFLHSLVAQGAINLWFEDDNGSSYFAAAGGLTSVAKKLAHGLEIKREQKVLAVHSSGSRLALQCEGGDRFEADEIVFSSPLPQSLEILRNSRIDYDSKLDLIVYAKALVGLFEVESLNQFPCYLTNIDDNIFSIAEQKSKGVSRSQALTITMSENFSERHFEASDDKTLQILIDLFLVWARENKLSFKVKKTQLKKWRYSHPLSKCESLSATTVNDPRIKLIGDAFGGRSLEGAFLSGQSVTQSLQNGF